MATLTATILLAVATLACTIVAAITHDWSAYAVAGILLAILVANVVWEGTRP